MEAQRNECGMVPELFIRKEPPTLVLTNPALIAPSRSSPPLIPSGGSVSRDQERGALLDPFELIKASFHL